MSQSFPDTPRASRAVRMGAIAIALVVIAIATRTTITSSALVGEVFPGFLVLDNRVIASIGFPSWPGAQVPGLYQSEILAMDDRPVTRSEQVYARAAETTPGTPVTYRLRRGGVERTATIATARFGAVDWLLLFGAYLLSAAVYLAAGLVPWAMRPRSSLSRVLLIFGLTCAVYLLTSMDLYGHEMFRLHVAAETLFPAAGFHLTLLFPTPHPLARYAWVAYALSAALLIPYQLVVYDPAGYTTAHTVAVLYLGSAAVLFAARLVQEYLRGRSHLARQRIRVVTLGSVIGFAPAGMIFVASALTGGAVSENAGALSSFLFAMALGYAVVKYDFFEIDAMVKRGAYYVLLTASVGGAYVAAVVLFNLTLQAGAVTNSPAFPVAFTLAVLLLFDPLRSRVQSMVDRLFFRTRYDSAEVLAAAGAELASALERGHIAALVRETVEAAIPNGHTRLFVESAPGGELREVDGTATIGAPLCEWLAEGRVATAFDPPEVYEDPGAQEAVRDALAGVRAEVAVPLELRGKLIGVLTVGAKRSGLFYTAGDAGFMRALAHQAAIALQNAASYEEVTELNARLEERVRERTAQLEATNRDLEKMMADLGQAEAQLVQQEKMASIGRLVAGVAHEINNPVSFIATSVQPLRRRLGKAADAAAPPVAKLLTDSLEIVDVIARGAERTAAIVKDLRTFSRLGEASRKVVDIHEGLDVSLRLLEPRWKDGLVIHRDYGRLPGVDCDAGQLNQVFVNLLSNACDATGGHGNIWIATRAAGDEVTISIRDDGGGIPEDLLGRIFDPFFTTKDVGEGTGLGLAISYGIVKAHGGRIEVESTPGEGTEFTVTLRAVETAAAARAAGGTG